MISDSEITECWKLITKDESVDKKEIAIKDGLIFGREMECDVFIASDHVSRKHAKLEVFEHLVRIVDLGSANGTYVNGKQVTEAELNNGDILSIDKVEFVVLKPEFSAGAVDNKTRVRAAVDINKTQFRAAVDTESKIKPEVELIDDDNSDTHVFDEPRAKGSSVSSASKAAAAAQKIDLNLDDSVQTKSDTIPPQNDSEDITEVMSSMDSSNTDPNMLQSTFKLDTPVAKLVCKTKPLQALSFDVAASPTKIGRVQGNDVVINEASVSSRHAELRFEHGDWYIFDQDSYNGTYVNGKKCSSQKLMHGDVIGVGRIQLIFEMSGRSTAKTKKNSLWLIMLIGLLIVMALAAYFIWPMLAEKKLSSTDIWMQIVADNRAGPTSPVADDVNRDGVRDIIIAAQSGRIEIINGVNGLSLSAFSIDKSIHSAPLVFDVNHDGQSDIIVASDDGFLAAYTQNGMELWQHKNAIPVTAIYNQIVRYYLNGDSIEDVLFATDKAGVVAVDGSNGKSLWNTAQLIKDRVITSPLVGDFNQDGIPDIAVVTDKNQMIAFSARNGHVSLLWKQSVPAVLFSSPVILKTAFNKLIFLATQKDGLVVLNAATGERVWQTPLNDNVYARPLVMQSADATVSYVIVSTLSGKVVAINANDGVIVWESLLGAKLQASPLLFSLKPSSDKLLLIADTEGRYSVLNAASGKRLLMEKQEGADRFVVTPLMVDLNNDGQPDVVLASQNGRIFAHGFQFK